MISLYIAGWHSYKQKCGRHSKCGLSLDVLTEILESWSRSTNLTLTNYFITYWTFKKCVIKTNKVVSSKYGLSLDVMTEIFESWSRITNLTLTNWTVLFKNDYLNDVSWKSTKCFLQSLDFLSLFDRYLRVEVE